MRLGRGPMRKSGAIGGAAPVEPVEPGEGPSRLHPITSLCSRRRRRILSHIKSSARPLSHCLRLIRSGGRGTGWTEPDISKEAKGR